MDDPVELTEFCQLCAAPRKVHRLGDADRPRTLNHLYRSGCGADNALRVADLPVRLPALVPDWRDPENSWPMWFYVAPLAFGGLGALFALLDKRRRLAWISLGPGLVLFLGLISVIALTR